MLSTKPKPNRCKHCRERMPAELARHVLHEDCIDSWLTAQAVKKEAARKKKALADAKVEKALDRQRKRALKTIPELIKEAQAAFNAFIRARDAGQPCICCGQPLGKGDIGGRYDAGHYRSTGSASHLRFDEANCHAQRKQCNRYGAGRAVDYRIGLIKRIGWERVEELEASNSPRKWTRDELIAIKDLYVSKLKELQRNQGEK